MTNQGYKEKFYDRLAIWVKKGVRDEYKAEAAKLGISLAALVQAGVEEYIENHGGEMVRLPAPSPPDLPSREERALLAAFAKCPDNFKPTVRRLINQLAGIEQ